MNYYDNNITTEYSENIYIPEPKNTLNKKKIIFIISLFLILIILVVGILFLALKNKKNHKADSFNNIIIENHTYEPSFSKDIYDYYLLTSEKELEIKCKSDKKIDGCNEKIDLNNYSYYIHEINHGDKIYKIYIKVKESDNEENIVINSIDKNNNWSNTNQIIKVNASSKNKIVEYSFDNGINWQKSNVFKVENNKILNIIVKDENENLSPVREVVIDNIDHINPTGIIVKTKSSHNKITLKVIAKDEESGIDSYSWNNNDYQKKDELIITEKGTYTVKIKDKAGNIENVSIQIKDSDFNDKTQFSVTLFKNGSTQISNDFLSCTKNDGKCIVTLPTIEKEGANIIGWSTKKDDRQAIYDVNEKITLNDNIVLYAITQTELTATFDSNKASSISKTKESCTLYNDDEYCYVEAPDITYNNGKIVGWNIRENIFSVLNSPGNRIKLRNNQKYYAIIYKNIIITFDSNGSDEISKTKEICRQQIGDNFCTIKTPNIIRKNSTIIGWSTNKNDTDYDVLANNEITVTENKTYYAITKKTITVAFKANGSDASSEKKEQCSLYNNDAHCQIITPNIQRKNANIIGWSTNKNATTKELTTNETINVKENKTYYAITKKEVTATFNSNGANKIDGSIKSCIFYNDDVGCTIKTPDIKRASWNVVGWSTNKDATTTTIKANSNITINDSIQYYAITYRKVTATYHINNADSLGNCTYPQKNGCIETCNIYNLNTGCEVKIPYIYSKGNEVQYFATGSDPSTTVGYSPAKKLKLLNDITLYAIVDNRRRENSYDIIIDKKYGYTAVETEKGCPVNVYTTYYNFLDKVYNNAPYIFSAAKMTFSTQYSFNKTWGNYAGMTYGNAIGYRNVDIVCPNNYSDYYLKTLVHELAHSWDSYYYAQTGNYLHNKSDIVSLYNKYKDSTIRPLRDYSYTNLNEFVADLYAWYYFLYIDNSYQPSAITSNLYYPSELKTVMDKYIKIAKSGYK